MKIRTLTMALATAAVTTFAAAGATHAQLTAFAIAGGTTSSANVFYTPGAGNGLTINGPTSFLQGKVGQGFDGNATVQFTNLLNGGYSSSGSGTFDQVLNPGSDTSSFVITDNTTHTVLLSGTLGTADLTGHNGASSGSVSLASDNVTYTGGTFLPAGFSSKNGTLAVEFNSTSPFVASGSGLSGFTGVDGITFSGVNTRGPGGNGVPEPASYASFGLGASMLILGLLRKKRSGRQLAS